MNENKKSQWKIANHDIRKYGSAFRKRILEEGTGPADSLEALTGAYCGILSGQLRNYFGVDAYFRSIQQQMQYCGSFRFTDQYLAVSAGKVMGSLLPFFIERCQRSPLVYYSLLRKYESLGGDSDTSSLASVTKNFLGLLIQHLNEESANNVELLRSIQMVHTKYKKGWLQRIRRFKLLALKGVKNLFTGLRHIGRAR